MSLKGLFVVMVAGALWAGCGGDDGGADGPVVDLGEEDQRALCDQFFDTVCGGSAADYCVECGASPPCDDATFVEVLESACDQGITAEQVRECADSVEGLPDDADPSICMEGGGCMFDVGDELCGA